MLNSTLLKPVVSPVSPLGRLLPSPTVCVALIAGEGTLPVHVAQNAVQQGFWLHAFSLFGDNLKALRSVGVPAERMVPGKVGANLKRLKQLGITHVVFAGKVNKWLLFKNPLLDGMALDFLKRLSVCNDDAMMLAIINALAQEGLEVLPQLQFMQELLLPSGQLNAIEPTPQQWKDIEFGWPIVKTTAGQDIGQSLVVHQCMVLAVEAIEGTDECLKRAGKLAGKKGGVVIKVSKPAQDERFDVPAVGLRTLNTMRKNGLKVLATEADKTLFLDWPAMQGYANKHGLSMVSINPAWAAGDGSLYQPS